LGDSLGVELAKLVRTYEEALEQAKVMCEKRCAGRESCLRKCLQREKEIIQTNLFEKFGIRVEVI